MEVLAVLEFLAVDKALIISVAIFCFIDVLSAKGFVMLAVAAAAAFVVVVEQGLWMF